MAKNYMSVGGLAFLIGIVGSLILGGLIGAGVFTITPVWTVAMIVVGLLIGLLNIKDSESVALMVAVLVLGAGAGVLANLPAIGMVAEAMLGTLAKVVLPAGIIVAVAVIIKKAK